MTRAHPSEELLTYLRILAHGARPTQFFDLRHSPPGRRMRRRYVSVLRPEQIARQTSALSTCEDVYLGAALRDRASGESTAISASHLLYIDCDDPAARERLEGFVCAPVMVIASGSPGHLHVYWRLREPLNAQALQSANRRLALALGGEPACSDIARMLRPPSTLNHKHSPPTPVSLLDCDPAASHTLADLLKALPDDPQQNTTQPPSRNHDVRRPMLERDLLAIPAAEYVRVLTGREPNQAGKVLCPFHQETRASLHLYPDGTFYCFGATCKKGGSIFDFAALLWGTGTREQEFLQLRSRLANTFGLTTRTTPR